MHNPWEVCSLIIDVKYIDTPSGIQPISVL